MKCPKCSREIPQGTPRCECGHELDNRGQVVRVWTKSGIREGAEAAAAARSSDSETDLESARNTDVGPGHIGLIAFIGAFVVWFSGEVEWSATGDWVGLFLFLAGCLLSWLDSSQVGRLWRDPKVALVGAAGVVYGWWSGRLPIAVAGAALIAAVMAPTLRRMLTGRR
jgi:hypothetical protein